MVTKFVGILPLTRAFDFDPRDGMYITLLMSTGLTFGTISALFGLTNHIIDQRQYTILVTAVIGSAVVPTLIAQRWFQPSALPFSGIIDRAKAKAVANHVPFEAHVIAGHAVSSIVEFIQRGGYDLLVIGYMGHSALYNRIIGSTTDRLVELAPCEVMVVK